jgi:hypothetical protein
MDKIRRTLFIIFEGKELKKIIIFMKELKKRKETYRIKNTE